MNHNNTHGRGTSFDATQEISKDEGQSPDETAEVNASVIDDGTENCSWNAEWPKQHEADKDKRSSTKHIVADVLPWFPTRMYYGRFLLFYDSSS